MEIFISLFFAFSVENLNQCLQIGWQRKKGHFSEKINFFRNFRKTMFTKNENLSLELKQRFAGGKKR